MKVVLIISFCLVLFCERMANKYFAVALLFLGFIFITVKFASKLFEDWYFRLLYLNGHSKAFKILASIPFALAKELMLKTHAESSLNSYALPLPLEYDSGSYYFENRVSKATIKQHLKTSFRIFERELDEHIQNSNLLIFLKLFFPVEKILKTVLENTYPSFSDWYVIKLSVKACLNVVPPARSDLSLDQLKVDSWAQGSRMYYNGYFEHSWDSGKGILTLPISFTNWLSDHYCKIRGQYKFDEFSIDLSEVTLRLELDDSDLLSGFSCPHQITENEKGTFTVTLKFSEVKSFLSSLKTHAGKNKKILVIQ